MNCNLLASFAALSPVGWSLVNARCAMCARAACQPLLRRQHCQVALDE